MPGSSRGSSSGRGGLTGIETGTACCLTEHGTPCGAVFPSFSGFFFFSVFFAARTLQFEILRTVTHQGSQSRRLHAVATLKMPDETLLSDFVIWLLAAGCFYRPQIFGSRHLARCWTGDHFTNAPRYLPRKNINYVFVRSLVYGRSVCLPGLPVCLPDSRLGLAIKICGLCYFLSQVVQFAFGCLPLNCADYLVDVVPDFFVRKCLQNLLTITLTLSQSVSQPVSQSRHETSWLVKELSCHLVSCLTFLLLQQPAVSWALMCILMRHSFIIFSALHLHLTATY